MGNPTLQEAQRQTGLAQVAVQIVFVIVWAADGAVRGGASPEHAAGTEHHAQPPEAAGVVDSGHQAHQHHADCDGQDNALGAHNLRVTLEIGGALAGHGAPSGRTFWWGVDGVPCTPCFYDFRLLAEVVGR